MHSKEFEEEYEILKSIYSEIEMGQETTAKDETIVSIVLYPSTCDDDETRYVTLCLEFNIPASYPSQPPSILFRNPRGLSETKLADLHSKLMKKCLEDLLDTPMLFQIIDSVQEFLTTNNLPASDCPICLNAFHPSDVFYRSKCFHYFHSQCLGKFLYNIVRMTNTEDTTINVPADSKMTPQFPCPVCREELDQSTIDIGKLLDSPPPLGETEEEEQCTQAEAGRCLTKVSAEWLEHQENMKSLYEKQEKQGGIIDLNQQLGKLLVISTPTSAPDEAESVESGESSESPDSGIGTASSASAIKVSLTSPDSSSQTSSNGSGRPPTKWHGGSKASINSAAGGRGHYHNQYRAHNTTFRHANHRSEGSTGLHKPNQRNWQGGSDTCAPAFTVTKESAGAKSNDAGIVKNKPGEPNSKQSESGTGHQSKTVSNGNTRPNQRAKATDNEARLSDSQSQRKQEHDQRKNKPVEGAGAEATRANFHRETDPAHGDHKDPIRTRNFRHHSHPRGHQNYNNHHSRGHGGARKQDHTRQNCTEDQ